jgi:hypothetical protein
MKTLLLLICAFLLCIVLYDATVIYAKEKDIQRLKGQISECEFRTNVMFNAVMGDLDSIHVAGRGHQAIK